MLLILHAASLDEGSSHGWGSALDSPFKKSLFNTKDCSTSSLDSQKMSPKMSLVNKMLYNVTSLLGAVGAGFDVRESSKLFDGIATESNDNNNEKDKKRPIHNTYHGVTRHVR